MVIFFVRIARVYLAVNYMSEILNIDEVLMDLAYQELSLPKAVTEGQKGPLWCSAACHE